MNDLVKKAQQFSTIKHQDQIRKGDNQPYITHPEGVYVIASEVTNDPAILAACWLHDTLEDTPTTYSDLLHYFGREVADIVLAVSENKSIKDWRKRKDQYLKNVFANDKAVIVAWADKMHNTKGLAELTDFSMFNVSLDRKLDFYRTFANMIADSYLRNKLRLVVDNIYRKVYDLGE